MNTVERVKELCKERGVSFHKLEMDLGFGNAYIGQLKKGTIPYDRLVKIAKYFGVSTWYLETGDNTSPYSDDMAEMVSQIRNDVELSKALTKYFTLSDDKKKHVVELINLLSEV
jgi:transcriptional regulator with XRE-family HTH domain